MGCAPIVNCYTRIKWQLYIITSLRGDWSAGNIYKPFTILWFHWVLDIWRNGVNDGHRVREAVQDGVPIH